MSHPLPAKDAAPPLFRTAPHNLEAEQALLGAILLNNEAHDRVADFLEPHHFFDPLHQQIYETATTLITAGKQATPITLKTYFDNAPPVEPGLPVAQYLVRLTTNAVTIINARDYGQTVYDMAIRRHLILIGEDVVNAAYDAPVDFPPRAQIEEAEARLFDLARTKDVAVVKAEAEIDASAQAHLDRKMSGEIPPGLSLDLIDLDRKIDGGLAPGDLVTVGGRPAQGKSGLLCNCIISAQDQDEGVVLFYSLELTQEQVEARLKAIRTGIPFKKIFKGDLTPEEADRLRKSRRWSSRTSPGRRGGRWSKTTGSAPPWPRGDRDPRIAGQMPILMTAGSRQGRDCPRRQHN
jgi:replicative DNA helicase